MKLSHIGIAVRNIDAALKIWQGLLGLKLLCVKEVVHHKVKIAMVEVGKTQIELLEATAENSAIKKFIDRRGEGLHHLCFEVDDIEEVLKKMKTNGMKLIDEVPRPGALAEKVAFIHPQDMNGVLIELCEKGSGSI